MPGHPVFSEPLNHPALARRIAAAAQRLGYDVI
jgi:hypothetical protein